MPVTSGKPASFRLTRSTLAARVAQVAGTQTVRAQVGRADSARPRGWIEDGAARRLGRARVRLAGVSFADAVCLADAEHALPVLQPQLELAGTVFFREPSQRRAERGSPRFRPDASLDFFENEHEGIQVAGALCRSRGSGDRASGNRGLGRPLADCHDRSLWRKLGPAWIGRAPSLTRALEAVRLWNGR